jgi:lipid-binding SYLF domain-containing protein
VRAFAQGGNVKLGGSLSAAAGPVGRDAEASVLPTAAVYTYSRSQGLFAGVSLEGAVIAAQPKTNNEYYGRAVTPDKILHGRINPPSGARHLISELAQLDKRR